MTWLGLAFSESPFDCRAEHGLRNNPTRTGALGLQLVRPAFAGLRLWIDEFVFLSCTKASLRFAEPVFPFRCRDNSCLCTVVNPSHLARITCVAVQEDKCC